MTNKKESTTINASAIVTSIAELYLKINVAEGQLHEMMQTRLAYIKSLQKAGFKTVQLGQSKTKAPKQGELAYNIASEMATAAFKASSKTYTDGQLAQATKDFVKCLKFSLEHGIWVNNPSRDGDKALETAKGGTVPPAKGKKERSPNTDKTIDVAKIAEGLNKKLSRVQTLALMKLLCAEISDKIITFEVVEK
jgi:hypothetical protein